MLHKHRGPSLLLELSMPLLLPQLCCYYCYCQNCCRQPPS